MRNNTCTEGGLGTVLKNLLICLFGVVHFPCRFAHKSRNQFDLIISSGCKEVQHRMFIVVRLRFILCQAAEHRFILHIVTVNNIVICSPISAQR